MLDIKYIRENPEAVKQGIKNKKIAGEDLLQTDAKHKDLIKEGSHLQAP